MTAYVVEITLVVLGSAGAVGYGIDELGREFAVALDVGLAADIAAALDDGQRPVVAVEKPLYPPSRGERAIRRWVTDHPGPAEANHKGHLGGPT